MVMDVVLIARLKSGLAVMEDLQIARIIAV
jgi:hypothetical protein